MYTYCIVICGGCCPLSGKGVMMPNIPNGEVALKLAVAGKVRFRQVHSTYNDRFVVGSGGPEIHLLVREFYSKDLKGCWCVDVDVGGYFYGEQM